MTAKTMTEKAQTKDGESTGTDGSSLGPGGRQWGLARKTTHHSKFPMFMRLNGSIIPKMILPLLFIGAWATCITVICEYRTNISVDSVLLTVLGIVVGLGLSFRSSSAYERWSEGRKLWSQLHIVSQNMARMIWAHVEERPGEQGKSDLLQKLTALNLISGFSYALMHKLRFQPNISEHPELCGRVQWLDTFAKHAEESNGIPQRRTSSWNQIGESLGVPFAKSNPRKTIHKSSKAIGNLPLEILNHLSAFANHIMSKEQNRLPVPYQSSLVSGIAAMSEVMIGTERVLNTPMPAAYDIVVSQITWVYVIMLPFQLWKTLRWVTIPATLFAAYIILGLAAIGREIENPFEASEHDLRLEDYCDDIASDIAIISSNKAPGVGGFTKGENKILFPYSSHNADYWMDREEGHIRDALRAKAGASFEIRRTVEIPRDSGLNDPNQAEHRHQPLDFSGV